MDKIYSIDEIKEKLTENMSYMEERFFVSKFLLFGSYSKGKQSKDSDIDLLVEFSKTIDMFMFLDLQEYLSELFGKKVDLGTINGLKKFAKDTILKEAIAL